MFFIQISHLIYEIRRRTIQDFVSKTKNFTVRQIGFIERAAENNVQEITGELLPTLSLNGSLTTNEEAVNRNSDSQTVAVTARVSMPLYSSGTVTSRVREAKQLLAQRRDEFSQAVRDATEAATSAWQETHNRAWRGAMET